MHQWASVLSRVALEQERMLPVVLDLLQTHSDLELRSLTGLLRNLSRHCKNKDDMGETQPSPSSHTCTILLYLYLSQKPHSTIPQLSNIKSFYCKISQSPFLYLYSPFHPQPCLHTSHTVHKITHHSGETPLELDGTNCGPNLCFNLICLDV